MLKKPLDNETVFVQFPHLSKMTEDRHCPLKNVKITGFSSAKGLVELTCYILKNAVSLEFLTLDTNCGSTSRCSDNGIGRCPSKGNGLREACRVLRAIRTYIENKVPSTVKLTVLEPCNNYRKRLSPRFIDKAHRHKTHNPNRFRHTHPSSTTKS